jgi:hypothetical protein
MLVVMNDTYARAPRLNKRLPIQIEAARKRYVWKHKTSGGTPEEDAVIDAAGKILAAYREPLLQEIATVDAHLAKLKEIAALMRW